MNGSWPIGIASPARRRTGFSAFGTDISGSGFPRSRDAVARDAAGDAACDLGRIESAGDCEGLSIRLTVHRAD